MNIFTLFNTGKQSLNVSKYEMNTVNENLANSGTEGYSKQKVSKEAMDVYPGVQITRVYRSVDLVLEKNINSITQDKEYFNKKKSELQKIEEYLNELNDGGISQKLDEFWNAWSELANEASTPSQNITAPSPVRTNIIQKAEDLARSINEAYIGISEQQTYLEKDIAISLTEVNNLLQKIATYNKEISKAERPEKEASVLKDKRQKALNDLAKIIDIKYINQIDNSITVYGPNGALLVANDNYWNLAKGKDANGRMHIYWLLGNGNFKEIIPTKGKLSAQLEVFNQKIPEYKKYIVDISLAIKSTVNTIHRNGYSVNGTIGINFFDEQDELLQVNSLIKDNPNLIATSSIPDAEGNNDIALEIANLREKKVMINNSLTIGEYIAKVSGQIGLEVKNADENYQIKDKILSSLKEKRSSVSEVNKDEELAKIMILEKNFQAASKMITVADNMLQTIINMVR